ncbi:MAG: FecR domain-containing protein [Sphingomonas bacterium]
MSSGTEKASERKAIRDAAAAWVIRLDAAPDARLQAEAGAWIDADPRHAVAFAEARYAWESAPHIRLRDAGEAAQETAGEPEAEAAPEPALLHRPISRRAAGLGLLAASAAGAVGLGRLLLPETDRHATLRGQQSLTRLADGSSIRLNTATTLDVRLTGTRRVVRMIEGEALFDVARDPRRPFIVDLGDAQVRVVGTSFNIRRRPDRTELTVTRGLVAVSDAEGQSISVGAGETTLIRPGILATALPGDAMIHQRTVWQEGFIELDNETIEEAVAEFNRYRDRPIVVADPRIGSLIISGRFGIHESREFVDALKSSFHVAAVTLPNGSIALTGGDRPAPASTRPY